MIERKIFKLMSNLQWKQGNFSLDGVLQRKLIQIMKIFVSFCYLNNLSAVLSLAARI